MREYTVGIYTLGCKVAQYESEAISERFESLGFTVLPFESVCDVYVINTCTVTAESDRKSRQFIRRAAKKNPEAIVLVTGCYSQRAPGEVASIPGVCAVLGTDNKLTLPSVAKELLAAREKGEKIDTVIGVSSLDGAKFEQMSITRAPRTRAYVKIEDGCDSKCTYCAIKEARGRIRSKAPSDVIREVETLSEGGTREVVLTGIEIGAYGKDFDNPYGLADLICELDRRGSCERIRIGSLAPELVNEEFIEKIKGCKILAPHFHISIQSGSDKILHLMKRRYTAKGALDVIERIRESIPEVQFTTDIMVGFPSEGEEEFCQTLEFVKSARLLDAHVFAYSRREGTAACYYDNQVEKRIKEERSARLIALQESIKCEILDSLIKRGREMSAIVETLDGGYYTAHTASYVEVKIPEGDSECDLRTKMVKVRPVSQKDGVLICNLCK